MELKLLVIVAMLVSETISSDYLEKDDDETPDVTEGSGDSIYPDYPDYTFPASNFTPGIVICYGSSYDFDPNITAEQLNETSIPGGAAGLIFSPSVLVPYFLTFVVSNF
ncbi:unnamed protein product [Arctia plantaginis]|uniref:Uncharacterized protein n=1 Tax=Arctia plantaginis TaxID=874455 RepID=A0A8S0ZBA5_ARCPL|nr:unnamed protein product [Arctia plantaginis]CAB3249632.1 unnamed protein product [Arctia plantaginis]